jgi:hypothetical protein
MIIISDTSFVLQIFLGGPELIRIFLNFLILAGIIYIIILLRRNL